MDISNKIKDISYNLVPHDISKNEILKIRNIRQTLFIIIFENNIYLLHGLKGEERHKQIINQIFKVKNKFNLPNVMLKFIYCDRVNIRMAGGNGCVFCHTTCKPRDHFPKKILAPCFSFDTYNSNDRYQLESYQDTMNKILTTNKHNKW